MQQQPDVDAGTLTMRRIKQTALRQKVNTQHLAQKFVLERVVQRLFASRHAEIFALKGGILIMEAEGVDPAHARTTDDVDLQVPGFDGTIFEFKDIVVEALSKVSVIDDGIRYDLGSINTNPRNEGDVPGGSLDMHVAIGAMRLKFKIDVTFDSRPVFKVAIETALPSVLPDFYAPVTVRRIPFSWTLADKIQAQVRHGARTTRLKDFYDIHLILTKDLADREQTVEALRMTFDLFGCTMPNDISDIAAFTEAYGIRNAAEWEREKIKRCFAVETPDLKTICALIREQVGPLIEEASALPSRDASDHLNRTTGFGRM